MIDKLLKINSQDTGIVYVQYCNIHNWEHSDRSAVIKALAYNYIHTGWNSGSRTTHEIWAGFENWRYTHALCLVGLPPSASRHQSLDFRIYQGITTWGFQMKASNWMIVAAPGCELPYFQWGYLAHVTWINSMQHCITLRWWIHLTEVTACITLFNRLTKGNEITHDYVRRSGRKGD